MTDAPADYIDGLTRAIVGIELVVARIEGKAKLSQNRPQADAEGVLNGLTSGDDRAGNVAALQRRFTNRTL